MNYWASDLAVTGELDALRHVAARTPPGQTVLDVGANVGDYSQAVLDHFPKISALHAFEPSQATARLFADRLAAPISDGRIALHIFGLSDREDDAVLHTAGEGSATASLHELSPITMDCVPHDPSKSETVHLTTLDRFCQTNGIDRIDLLKVDVEGHELMVLNGAKEMLGGRRIRFVQFEFGAFNLDSRTFLRDLFELLTHYKISRIVPGGLVEIPRYEPRLERFATMNYLAELR